MIIDVHCHVGFSDRPVESGSHRFTFERHGAEGRPGCDSYFSPRLLARRTWWFMRRFLGIDTRLAPGQALDAAIAAANERHWTTAPSADRLVLLAFDEYRDDDGRVIGPARPGQQFGSDLFASNSLVRSMCDARPDRYLFGASVHPYRRDGPHSAIDLLEEVVAAGCVLVKWLPIHQNICIRDARTVAFLRAAARLGVTMLIHYGGEMSLGRQHMEFESPEPLIETLRLLRGQSSMPKVIVAHAATPSFPWQSPAGHRALLDAMTGEFADEPLYADISALAAFGRTMWLRRLARTPAVHRKLLWGTDFPIPVFMTPFHRYLDRPSRRALRATPSWIERDLLLKRFLGFDAEVFTRAAELFGLA